MEINLITGLIIDKAMKVHSELGPGLLESTYETCLSYDLEKEGIRFRTQVELPLIYKEVHLEKGYRVDLLVEECVIVEIKSVEIIKEVHQAQVLTYLRLSKCKIGLLLNFNVASFRDGIKRFIL